MQTDHNLMPLKCLLEGAIYKELGEDDMAITVRMFCLVWFIGLL